MAGHKENGVKRGRADLTGASALAPAPPLLPFACSAVGPFCLPTFMCAGADFADVSFGAILPDPAPPSAALEADVLFPSRLACASRECVLNTNDAREFWFLSRPAPSAWRREGGRRSVQ